MSYFEKQANQGDLVYDNIAFYHFFLSVSLILSVFIFILILRDIINWRKPKIFSKLQKLDIFKDKLKNYNRLQKNKRINKNFIIKLMLLLIFIALAYYSIYNILKDNKLNLFDPYQILKINKNSNTTQIKKAYRKLVLTYHPDKSNKYQDDYNQFLLITKAYRYLTDEKTRQNCQKFGNPEGQQAFKIGIGLPSFILQPKYSKYIGYFLLVLILILLPYLFFNWIQLNKIKIKKQNSKISQNLSIMHKLITPKLNTMDCCIIFGTIKQIKQKFKEKLDFQAQNNFKLFLAHSSNLSQKMLTKLSSQQIYSIYTVFNYFNNINNFENDLLIASKVPQICKKIVKFSLLCTKKSLQDSYYTQDSKLKIKWYGFKPCKQAIMFSRQMFYKSFELNLSNLLNYQAFFQQGTQQNLLYNQMNLNQLKTQQQFSKLKKALEPQKKQKTMNILQLLPTLKIETKTFILEEQVNNITPKDLLNVKIIITKLKQTPNYVLCQKYPVIAQQQFILLVSSNVNLLTSYLFRFDRKQNQIAHSFILKKLSVGEHILNIKVLSLCYFSQISQTKKIIVSNKQKKKPIQFHQQDQKVQNIPKNFYQNLISFDFVDSDIELSDSQQQFPQNQFITNKRKSNKLNNKRKNFTKQIKTSELQQSEQNVQKLTVQNSIFAPI